MTAIRTANSAEDPVEWFGEGAQRLVRRDTVATDSNAGLVLDGALRDSRH